MLERGRGKMIFMASLLSFQGGINVAGYTAAKAASPGSPRRSSNEWASRGVNVNAVAPGYIATDNTQALQEDPVRSGHPRPHPGRPLGHAHGHRGRRRVPRVVGLRLRQRRRPAGRRRLARPMSRRCSTVAAPGVPVVVIDATPGRAARHAFSPAASLCRGDLSDAGAVEASARWLAGRQLLIGAGTVVRPARSRQSRRAPVSSCRPASAPPWSDVRPARRPGLPRRGDGHRDRGGARRRPRRRQVLPRRGPRGRAALIALAAPFPGVRFVPTGGIAAANAREYLAVPSSLAVGGSWMVATGLLADRRFGEVSRLTAAAVADVRRARTAHDGIRMRPAADCRYDAVALGEVMLRLDPGEGHPITRRTSASGRAAAIQRGPRPAPVLRPADGRRDRLGRQRGRPAGRGPRPAGRGRYLLHPLGPVRRRRS